MANELNSFEAAQQGAVGGQPAGGETPQATPGGATPGQAEEQFEIKWNGQVVKVPRSQMGEFAQKGYDYTQKMQALAKDREAFQSERQRYEQAIAEVKAFLEDDARVGQYYQELLKSRGKKASGPSATQADPEGFISQAELESHLQRAREELLGKTQQEIAQMRQQLQIEAMAGQYNAELTSHIQALKTQIPELRAIPKVEQILKEDVRQMRPRTIEEAKEMLVNVAQQHARDVRQYLDEQRKTEGAGAGASGALANGIEPRGGSGPLPTASAQKFKGFNDPAFKQAILDDWAKMGGTGR